MCSRQTALITLSSFSIPLSIAQQIQSKTQVIDPSETHVCFHVLLTMLWASFRDNVYLCFPSVYHIAAPKPYSKADLPLENQAFRSCSIWDLFFLFFSSSAIDCSPTEIQILSRCLLWSNAATTFMQMELNHLTFQFVPLSCCNQYVRLKKVVSHPKYSCFIFSSLDKRGKKGCLNNFRWDKSLVSITEPVHSYVIYQQLTVTEKTHMPNYKLHWPG